MKIKSLQKIMNAIAICFIALPFIASAQSKDNSALDEMASPVTNPVNFEDPRISSELRPIYAYHKIDDKFITKGGDVRLYALQLRYAVTEDFAVIATKDGWIDFNPKTTLNDESGFANLAGGFKYSLYKNNDAGQIVTAGLKYEARTGEKEVFQGNGDGIINPFISAATTLCNYNLMAGTGFRLPIDDADSTIYDFDLHLDTKFGNFKPLVEFNLVHVVDAGSRLPIPDEGQDLFNFGSSLSDGETILTAGAGFRYDLTKQISLGAAYQFPIDRGSGSSIIDYRVITDLIVRF